jgi:AcrR family transcriptional regulator
LTQGVILATMTTAAADPEDPPGAVPRGSRDVDSPVEAPRRGAGIVRIAARDVADSGGGDLPVVGAQPRMRADAARNRRKVLDAAQRLFERHGVANVSMDAIAREAGVGKGTLFRRFGDRATLALSVLEESERQFQEATIRGPAPLGPGAPPVERLVAFGNGLIERLEAHGDLILAAETSGPPLARFRVGAYGFQRAHVDLLVREAAPALSPDYIADALLAALGAELYLHLRHDRGLARERIAEGFAELVRGLLTR